MNKTILKTILTTTVFCLVTTAALAQIADTFVSPPPLVTLVPTPTTVPTASPTPVDKPLSFEGKFGIGYEYIRVDEVQNTSYNNFVTNNLLSLDTTYWISNQTALDILATANAGSYMGTDFNGNSTNFPNTTWGGGLQLRDNLSAPLHDLRLQALFRATYAQFSQEEVNWSSNYNITYQIQDCYSETFLLSAGLGFEYYLPFCDSLSVQGNLAYSGAYNDGWISETFNPKYNVGANYTIKYSNYRTAFVLTGLTLSGVSVHFYF